MENSAYTASGSPVDLRVMHKSTPPVPSNPLHHKILGRRKMTYNAVAKCVSFHVHLTKEALYSLSLIHIE